MTNATEATEAADRAVAQRVRECVEAFGWGCSNAGPRSIQALRGQPSDPADCPECVQAFLTAVRAAVTP